MTKVEIPAAFKKACRNLGQGLDTLPQLIDRGSPIPGMVSVALIGIDQQDASVIATFIKQILAGGYSDDELRDFWWQTHADTYFHNGADVGAFLRQLLVRIEAPPYT